MTSAASRSRSPDRRARALASDLSERVGRNLTRWTLRWYFGAEHRDTHHIPETGPAILVSNHPSIIDPFHVAFGTRRWDRSGEVIPTLRYFDSPEL